MTTPSDAYWDELGVAWCAIHPEIEVLMPRLKSRLRRQSCLIVAGLVIGLPLGIAGILLGAYTAWRGWTTETWNFVSRGVALVAFSAILAMAASLLLPVRASGRARTLPEMLDLAIARAERILSTVRLGFYACAAAAVLAMAGAAIRFHYATPPAVSPLIDLAVLAAVALGLWLYGRHAKATLAKFRYLKRAIAMDGA